MRTCPHCSSPYAQPVEFCGIDGTRLVEREDDPLIGNDVDRFRILEAIGDGGMARVYRVRHHVLEREFAMKVLFGEYAANRTIAQRFKREAQTISRIDHPNVVTVADFGRTPEGLTFLTMELVRGRTLRRLVKSGGSMDPPRVAAITRQIASGLHAAHELGFVHRDLKPSNIMLVAASPFEIVKILDFGLARMADSESDELFLTRTGQFLGTPIYMAPEQIIGADVDHRADLYSLGVVMFEMLEGQPPFKAKKLAEIRHKHLVETPPDLRPCGGLERVVQALLAKSAAERPSSAAQVVEQLDRLGLDRGAPDPITTITDGSIEQSRADSETVRAPVPLPNVGEAKTRRVSIDVSSVAAGDAVVDADPDATRLTVPRATASTSAVDPEPGFERVGPDQTRAIAAPPLDTAESAPGEARLDSSIAALDVSRDEHTLTPVASKRPVVALVAGLSVGAAVALGVWLTRESAAPRPAALVATIESATPKALEKTEPPPVKPPPVKPPPVKPPPTTLPELSSVAPPPPERVVRRKRRGPPPLNKKRRTRLLRKMYESIDSTLERRGLLRADLELEPTTKTAWAGWRSARDKDDTEAWHAAFDRLIKAIDKMPIDPSVIDRRLDRISQRLLVAAETVDADKLRPLEDRYLGLVADVRPSMSLREKTKALRAANELLRALRAATR